MSLGQSFHNHRNLFYVTVAYAVVVLGVCLMCDVSWARLLLLGISALFFSIVYFQILLGVYFVKALIHDRPNTFNPFKFLGFVWASTEKHLGDFFHTKLAKDGAVTVLIISFYLLFFCYLKSLFPVISPTNWDSYWAGIDLWLHGGKYPHQYLLPFVQTHNLEIWLERVYIAWFLIMYFANTYCFFYDGNEIRRKQFIWSFVLCWMVAGSAMAIGFYSAGPIFYHLINPDIVNPYAELLAWMQVVNDGKPAFAYDAGMALYGTANDAIHPDLNGTSAMPSQHVGIAWLMALYAFQFKRWLGILMTVFTLAIMIGSVILGWHYAVDGYVGVIVVTLIWLASGFVLRRKAKNVQA